MHGSLTTTPATAITGSVEPPSSASSDRQRELASLWRTIVRRRATVLQIFIGFVVLMFVGTLVWPKQYTTTIKLIAGNENGPASSTGASNGETDLPVLNALVLASGMQTSETYAELFVESPVVRRVIAQLNLHVTPRELLEHVAVAPVTNTNILSVQVTWKDPQTSAAIANAFGDAIVARERELVSSQANAALTDLAQQLPVEQAHMNAADHALTTFEAQHRILNLDEQTQATVTNMAALDAKIGQSQADLQQAQASLGAANSQLGSLPATVLGQVTQSQNPVVSQLQNQLTQVNIQLQNAEQEYTDQHPTVIGLKAQQQKLEQAIAREQQTVVSGTSRVPNPVYQQVQTQAATFRAQVAADQAQVAEYKRQLAAAAPQLAALPQQGAQLADLQRSAKAAEDVYTALQSKYVNARVASETAISDVTVTQPANAHEAVVRPSLLLNMVISVLLGGVLGITGALLLDYLDNSIRDERQVEEELSMPQLGSIPFVQLRGGSAVVPWVKSLALDSFLQLVTNMRYATDEPLRSLAVLSPTQGDGKSTIALNVALALNELEGPVLLVDADLRRPSLHNKLSLPNDRGLSDVLVGQCSLDQAIQIDGRTGMATITSGTAAPNPIKLLESQRFDEILKELQTRYKTIVFDGAALMNNVDSAVLARRTTGTLLVVSHGGTDLREASSAVKRLQRMGVRNILGFVVNRVEPRRMHYAPYGGDMPRLGADDAPIVVATR